jgi:hypothetical protein
MNRHATIMTSNMSTIINGQIHHQDDEPPHVGHVPNHVSQGGFCAWASASFGRIATPPFEARKIADFRHIATSMSATKLAATVLDGEERTKVTERAR